jgi:hypothetical protein
MGQQAWEARVRVKITKGSVDEYMSRGNSGRGILGQALRSSWDWTVRGWMQLSCLLEHHRNARQQAHNSVAKIVENCMDNIHGNHRISVWDKQVSTFLHSLEMSRPQALLLNALTIKELGTWKRVIGLKRTPQQQACRKRTLDDIKTYFAREDLTKRPDGMIFDFHHRTIYVIEEAGLVKSAVREVKAAEAF